MSWRSLLPLLALPILVACPSDKDEDEDDDDSDDSGDADDGWGGEGGGGEGGGTGGGGGSPEVSVSWGGSSVDIEVSSGTWYFGMAETACGSDCWTGEDCLYGYTLDSGDVLGPYCHDIGSGDSLSYGGDPTNLQPGSTVFSSSFEGSVTYVLLDPSTEACFTWGDDTSYYSDFCGEL